MKQLIALLKTLMMRDSDPEDINKPWYRRRRTVMKILAVVGFGLYYKWGLVLDNDMKDMIIDNYEVITSSVEALVAAGIAVYGVVGSIVGQRKQTKKLEAVIASCVDPVTPAVSPAKPGD